MQRGAELVRQVVCFTLHTHAASLDRSSERKGRISKHLRDAMHLLSVIRYSLTLPEVSLANSESLFPSLSLSIPLKCVTSHILARGRLLYPYKG